MKSRISIFDCIAIAGVILVLLSHNVESQDTVVRCMWDGCIEENEACESGATCVFITEGYSQCRENEDGYIPPLFVEGCVKLTDGAAAPPYSNGVQVPCSSTSPCCNSDALCLSGKCLLSCSAAREPTVSPTMMISGLPTVFEVTDAPIVIIPTAAPTNEPTNVMRTSSMPTFAPSKKSEVSQPSIAPTPATNSTSSDEGTNPRMSIDTYLSVMAGIWAIGLSSVFYMGFLFTKHQKNKKDRERMEKLYERDAIKSADDSSRYFQQVAPQNFMLSFSHSQDVS